jgi:hypothetical protein
VHVHVQYKHYKACLELFKLKPSNDSREFIDLISFVAQVGTRHVPLLGTPITSSSSSSSMGGAGRSRLQHHKTEPAAVPSACTSCLMQGRSKWQQGCGWMSGAYAWPLCDNAMDSTAAGCDPPPSPNPFAPGPLPPCMALSHPSPLPLRHPPTSPQVSKCYPDVAESFSGEVMALLEGQAATLDPPLRKAAVQALILLRNRHQVGGRGLESVSLVDPTLPPCSLLVAQQWGRGQGLGAGGWRGISSDWGAGPAQEEEPGLGGGGGSCRGSSIGIGTGMVGWRRQGQQHEQLHTSVIST